MDLRVRLLAFLAGGSVALLLAASLVVALNLRDDVADEVAASARLVDVMLSIGEARESGSARVEELLAAGELRHVRVVLDRSDLEQASPSATTGGPLLAVAHRLSGTEQGTLAARRVELADGRAIHVIPDPDSEVREILGDAARMLALLAVFAFVLVIAAWRSTDRALRPVRALEEGLERLAQGERRPRLPAFELREFGRIAVAIDHLADALERARATERRLARSLMDVQEAERRELARELHDEFGQSLTAIGAAAAFVERHAAAAEPAALAECARDIRSESARVSAHVRGLLRQLRPYGLEGLGMRDALRELIDGWRARAPQAVIDAELAPVLPPLKAETGLALYRTLQEALTNVFRHSAARLVRVRLAVQADALLLSVADDGGGRAVEVLHRARGGLLGMRERAEMAGGALEVGDSPYGGVEIGLRLPIEKQEGDTTDDPHPVAR